MQCTIEIFERGQWKPCCLVETDAPEAGPASPSILSYFPSYIKEGTLPVSLHYPIRSEPYRLVHWPSFLLDLIPDGEGREYLLYEHHLPDNKALDWQLMLLGAINPLGNLRIREAYEAYRQHLAGKAATWIERGFTIQEILERHEDFVEYLEEHGMLSAGTTSIHGKTPKFLMTQGKDGLWYADAALPDEKSARHFLVKLSPGRNLADWKVLENEAGYLHVAREMGLFVSHVPKWQSDMLFIPRFDREVSGNGVIRYPVESLVSLCGIADESVMPSQNAVLKTLRRFANAPADMTLEYIKRDMLNMALGNTDNHPCNTAMESVGGKTRLAPLFNFAPSHLLIDDISRSLEWVNEKGEILDDWNEIIGTLDLPDEERHPMKNELKRFSEKLAFLSDIMKKAGIDDDIIEARYYSIANLCTQLKE